MKTILKFTALSAVLLGLPRNTFAEYNNSLPTTNESTSSFKHSIGVDFYPFLYNLRFQGKEQAKLTPYGASSVHIHNPKFWNLYYEYSLGRKNNDKIKTNLKIGFWGYYDKEKERAEDVRSFNDLYPKVFPYIAGYTIQQSAVGGSLGINREEFFYSFFGLYGGIDVAYVSNPVIFRTFFKRNMKTDGFIDLEDLDIYHLQHSYKNTHTHQFAIMSQLGLSFRFFDRLTIRAIGVFNFSFNSQTTSSKLFFENPDGTIILPHPSGGYTILHPSKTQLNINPQITFNYAF